MTVKYLSTVKPGVAKGLVADVYAQVQRDFGRVVEPFELHSPLPTLLAGAWMACRESELVGIVPRITKEVIAATVSQLNNCPYCVDAHTIMLTASGEEKIANAISKAHYEEITDQKIFAIVRWTLASTSPRSELLRSLPVSKEEAPEIIGTTVFYHYMNRMANALLGETPLPSNKDWLKGPLKSIAANTFSGAVKRPKIAGDSLDLLPKAELPNDLKWARFNPNVSNAYARFASAVEEAGQQALPTEVRAHVEEELSKWFGETSELSLAWCEDALSQFSEPTASAARLAVLTALAPNRIDQETILSFRKQFSEDTKLLGALAWASFSAARRIGTWLQNAKS